MIRIHIRTGFTIIELMIVVVIIGLLATSATLIYLKNQKRAQDARRVEDIININEALKLYYQQQFSYPHENDTCSVNGSLYDTSNCDDSGNWTDDGIKTELVNNGYMKNLPIDPVNKYEFQYYYEPFAAMADDCKIAECVQMLVGAILDNPQNDGQAFCRIDNDSLDSYWKNWCDNF